MDAEQVARLAVERVQSSGILFIDEIDKIAGPRGRPRPRRLPRGRAARHPAHRRGHDRLHQVRAVRTDHVLFIAAGAFHVSKPRDLIPELQGRFPIRVELEPLTQEDLVRILTEPQERAARRSTGRCSPPRASTLTFTDEAVREMARFAMEVNQATENIGARRLATILETVLEDVSFEGRRAAARARCASTPTRCAAGSPRWSRTRT